jgi:hypothetical protein
VFHRFSQANPAERCCYSRGVRVNLHHLAEERSLALHRLVAERARVRPAIYDQARARVGSWLETGAVASHYVRAWQAVLARPDEDIATFLGDEGEHARALRQVTPFAGVVDPRTRWRIWRDVRARLEAA